MDSRKILCDWKKIRWNCDRSKGRTIMISFLLASGWIDIINCVLFCRILMSRQFFCMIGFVVEYFHGIGRNLRVNLPVLIGKCVWLLGFFCPYHFLDFDNISFAFRYYLIFSHVLTSYEDKRYLGSIIYLIWSYKALSNTYYESYFSILK